MNLSLSWSSNSLCIDDVWIIFHRADAIIKKTEKRHGDLELLEYVRDEFKKVTASVNESKRHLDQKKDLVNFLMQNQIFGMPVSKDIHKKNSF